MSNGNLPHRNSYGILNQPYGSAGQNEPSYRLPQMQGLYPIGAFPEIVRRAVIDVDTELGGGVELGASAALGVVSLVCQEFINVERPKLRPSACSLFLITIAGTGAGKSEIAGRFMSAVERFEREEEARARDASADYRDISSRERLSRLRALRAERVELLARYDDMQGQLRELEKKEKKPHVETRRRSNGAVPSAAEREREWRESTQQARAEIQALKPGLEALEKRLSDIERTIRSLMGENARRLVYGRGSFAGFRNGLQDKSRTAGIMSAEAGGILNSPIVTRNMDAWNDLWGTEFYRETYDKREYVIDAPRLTLALMLQPKQFEKFVDMYGENALDNGFLSRALLLSVPSQSPKLAGGGDDAGKEIASLKRFHERVREILDQDFPWMPDRLVLKLNGKARRYWETYYNELVTALERGQFDREMEGFVRKLPEQAARIAALFHYFERYPIETTSRLDHSTGFLSVANNEIPLETIHAAIELCDWYMAEFRKLIVSHELPVQFSSWVYSTHVRTNAERIYQTIQRNYRKYEAKQQSACIRLSYRDVQNGNRGIKNRADILDALHCLAAERRVHLGTGPNRGVFICFNPSQIYCCGRCIYPMASYPTVTPPAVKPVHSESPSGHQSPEVAQGDGIGEALPPTHVIDDEWPRMEDGSPATLLDLVKAKHPEAFFRPNVPTGMNQQEDDEDRIPRTSELQGDREVGGIEIDDLLALRSAQIAERFRNLTSDHEDAGAWDEESGTDEDSD